MCSVAGFANLLKQSGKRRALSEGREIHARILGSDHSGDPFLGNLLIEMYGNCGSLHEAWLVFRGMLSEQRNVYSWNLMASACARNGEPASAKLLFDQMPRRDLVSWNALLTGYARAGAGAGAGEEEALALEVFEMMPGRDGFSWNLVLSVHAQNGEMEGAREVFHKMESRDVLSWTTLLHVFSKSGRIEDVESLFWRAPSWDVICWNALITGYEQNGQIGRALWTFEQMPERNSVTWIAVIHALNHHDLDASTFLSMMPQWSSAAWNASVTCATTWEESFLMFQRIPQRDEFSWNAMISVCMKHTRPDQAVEFFGRMPCRDVVSCNGVISAFANLGRVEEAESVFNTVAPARDVVSWNAMISAFSQHGYLHKARWCFETMPVHDPVSWNSLLQAYTLQGRMERASEVYERLPCFNFVASTLMIQALSSLGRVECAEKVFEEMPCRDEVSWNSMIAGYARNKKVAEAKQVFDRMSNRTVVSWNSMLQAYTEAEPETATIFFHKLPATSVASWNSVIQAFAALKNMARARECFEIMPERDLISWNGMISAHLLNREPEKSFRVLSLMDFEGTKPDAVSYMTVLDACAVLSDVTRGRRVHSELVDNGMELQGKLATALLNMYSKCSHVDEARALFGRTREKSLVSWTAMVAAFSENGYIQQASGEFQSMQLQGFEPDRVSFINILSACSHAGSVDAGVGYFGSMVGDYGIKAEFDHYGCVVDLLGRAGKVEESKELMEFMPFYPDPVNCMSFLSACRSQPVGVTDVKKVVDMDQVSCVVEDEEGPDCLYVLVSGIQISAAVNKLM